MSAPVVVRFATWGMGLTSTFQNFLEWGLNTYPAERTMVCLEIGNDQILEMAPVEWPFPDIIDPGICLRSNFFREIKIRSSPLHQIFSLERSEFRIREGTPFLHLVKSNHIQNIQILAPDKHPGIPWIDYLSG